MGSEMGKKKVHPRTRQLGLLRMRGTPKAPSSSAVPERRPRGNSVSPPKPRCPGHTSSVACRVGTRLWPWVAATSLREIADEGTWTWEDRKTVLIVLTKTRRAAANCWTSRPEPEYAADPWVQDQIRFQKENPGFDFSGAEISGNHTNGGPDFSNLEK